jgi:hypothetical protein
MHKELADLGKQLSAEKSHSRSFTLPVISVSDEGNRVKVQLCTGTVIEVPASILRGSLRSAHWNVMASEKRLRWDGSITRPTLAS